jgi:multiple antibiotic resistance protein
LQEHIQAIVTLLSLVNPIICAMMFGQAETGRSRSAQLIDATKAALVVTLILLFFALLGTQLLHQFGVSLDAFMVAGGGVLAWMGFGILSGQQAAPASPAADSNTDTSLTPLILFAASPGTITGDDHHRGRSHAIETARYSPRGYRCRGGSYVGNPGTVHPAGW